MNPIEQAVAPLKDAAVDRARKEATDLIERILKKLEENGWDLNLVAPNPRGTLSRQDYIRAKSIRDLYQSVTTYTKSSRRPDEPDIRARSVDAENRFIQESVKDAAFQYDLFVAKLVKKIGPVQSAELEGNHVWGYSILTVVLTSGEVQRWKTQQIVNVSSLGKLFNQWPTRKVR
jgi:hypothetical protein